MNLQKSHVAIIGGGFSGAMTAVHLFKQKPVDMQITIVEPRSKIGLGLAYSTECDDHLLNVPAWGMSALPNDLEHFLDFTRSLDKNILPGSYAQRKVYGQYVNAIFAAELAKWQDSAFQHMQAEAVDIEKIAERYRLFLSDNSSIEVDDVVLALGNLSGNKPSWLKGLDIENTKYIHNPWNAEAMDAVSPQGKILLVGSGLTAVDKIIELKGKGHLANLYVLSRHGLLPKVHALGPQSVSPQEIECSSTLGSLRTFRQRISGRDNNGSTSDWRTAIDALRSTTQKWWLSLPSLEQKRFLRHLQSYWDIHRHRMAPNIGAKIEEAIQLDQIKVIAGRITSISQANALLSVDIKERGKNDILKIVVNKIINCTGPQSSLRTVDSLLLTNLLIRGLICSNDLGNGLAVHADGQILNDVGKPVAGLFAIGPLLKPKLMESVAVPELREQAFHLAKKLAKIAQERHAKAKSV